MPDQTTQTVFKLYITYALAGWSSFETLKPWILEQPAFCRGSLA